MYMLNIKHHAEGEKHFFKSYDVMHISGQNRFLSEQKLMSPGNLTSASQEIISCPVVMF